MPLNKKITKIAISMEIGCLTQFPTETREKGGKEMYSESAHILRFRKYTTNSNVQYVDEAKTNTTDHSCPCIHSKFIISAISTYHFLFEQFNTHFALTFQYTIKQKLILTTYFLLVQKR